MLIILSILSKWFEPRSISSLSSVIVRVSVVIKRTVSGTVTDVSTMSGSHLQGQSNILSSVDGIYVSGY